MANGSDAGVTVKQQAHEMASALTLAGNERVNALGK